ncbi:MAG: hypothetical protein QM698_01485 [Micropepsaceae bacterium]
MAFKDRLAAHDVQSFGPINHGFCHSVYFFDPNGIALEFTVKDERHDEILDHEEEISGEVMRKWIADTASIRAKANAPAEAAE